MKLFLKIILFTAIACLIILPTIFFIDLPVAEAANALNPELRHYARQFSNFGDSSTYLIIAAFFVVLRKLIKKKWNLWPLILCAATLAVNGIFCQGFKYIFRRCRPEHFFTSHECGFFSISMDNHHLSFPSGHTADAFAMAMLLWVMAPRWRVLWLTWAIMMATARIISLRHYPSDAMAGATIGILVAGSVLTMYKRWIQRKKEPDEFHSI